MNRSLSRNRLRHQAGPGRRSRGTGRHRVHPRFLEPLEDRTLLSGPDWSTVGPGLASIFAQLQTGVNDHLLAPNNPKVQYSLPLVGNQLGQSSEQEGQVFAGLANQITSAFQQDPPTKS